VALTRLMSYSPQLARMWISLQAVLCVAACNGHNEATGRLPNIAVPANSAVLAVVRLRSHGSMSQGQGSCFFIKSKTGRNMIVTNKHVVWGAEQVSVERSDGVTDTATVIGSDAAIDLALLQPGSNSAPKTLDLASGAEPLPGDWLISMGSPGGVFNAASAGIVSARGTLQSSALSGERLVDYLFTDAKIGPGSSGGAVVDLQARLVGMNTGVVGNSGGLGIIMPVRLIASELEELERTGGSSHGYAGLAVADGCPSPIERGIRVLEVSPNGPAATAGVPIGACIQSLNGRTTSARDFRFAVFTSKPGTSCTLEIALENGKGSRSIEMRLGVLPELTKPMEQQEASHP